MTVANVSPHVAGVLGPVLAEWAGKTRLLSTFVLLVPIQSPFPAVTFAAVRTNMAHHQTCNINHLVRYMRVFTCFPRMTQRLCPIPCYGAKNTPLKMRKGNLLNLLAALVNFIHNLFISKIHNKYYTC